MMTASPRAGSHSFVRSRSLLGGSLWRIDRENGTGVVVEDGDDVSPGKDHSEFEGELCGFVGSGQLAPVGGSVRLLKKEVAPCC